MGFEDYATSARFRDIVTQLIEKTVENIRPRTQYAEVKAIDTVNRRVQVRYPGETSDVWVAYGAVAPATVGQYVRIDGPRGDRYVADVLGPASVGSNETSGSNRIPNGSMEILGLYDGDSGIASWTKYAWYPSTAPTSMTWAPYTSDARTGRRSMRITWTGATAGTRVGARTSPYFKGKNVWPKNTNIMLVFWVKHLTTPDPGFSAQLAADTAGYTTSWVENPTAATGVWQRYALKITIGSADITSNLYPCFAGTAGDLLLDDVDLYEGEVARPYQGWVSEAYGEWLPGDILETARTGVRPGFLPCDNSAYNISDYPDLYAIISTTFGTNGAGTFRTPDHRGRVGIGAGTGSGLTNRSLYSTSGAESHTLTNSEMPLHSHGGATGTISADHSHSFTTAAGGSHTHVIRTTNMDGGGGFNQQGYPAGNNHNGVLTTDRTGVLTFTGSVTTDGSHTHTGSTGGVSSNHVHSIANDGGGGAHNNMQPWIAMNYYIKT